MKDVKQKTKNKKTGAGSTPRYQRSRATTVKKLPQSGGLKHEFNSLKVESPDSEIKVEAAGPNSLRGL